LGEQGKSKVGECIRWMKEAGGSFQGEKSEGGKIKQKENIVNKNPAKGKEGIEDKATF